MNATFTKILTFLGQLKGYLPTFDKAVSNGPTGDIKYIPGQISYDPPESGTSLDKYVAELLQIALKEEKVIFGVFGTKPLIVDPDLGVKQLMKLYHDTEYHTDRFEG